MTTTANVRLPSFSPRADLEALKRQLSSLFPKGRTKDTVAGESEDTKKAITEVQPKPERYVARPGDTLEVKGTDGHTYDIWQVLESSASNSSQVLARSLRTGATIRIPARIFELKKFAEASNLTTERLPQRFFVVEKEKRGWTIKNVPIMATEARGQVLYDEAYLDRLVQTYWGDKQSVIERHGPGTEPHAYEPPVIVGHTSDDPELRNDQREAIGYITALWRSGKYLMANLGGFSDEWIERLRKGALPNRSCELKVKAARIVALALLSEEPYFHLPQMKNFSARQVETQVFRFQYEGDVEMQELQQLVECLKTAASLAESIAQNMGDGGGKVTPPNPPAGGTPSQEATTKTQQFSGGQTDPQEVENQESTGSGGAGVQKPHVGEKPADTPNVDGKGPTETASTQKGDTGKTPNPDWKLSEAKFSEKEANDLRNRVLVLERTNREMGEKLKFAVSTIDALTTEKRKLSFKARLEGMLRNGVPLGGAEGVERHLKILLRMSDEDAEKYLADLDALPKVSMRTRHSMTAGTGSGSVIDEQLQRFAADFKSNPDKYQGTGYDSPEVFAASQLIGELMGGGDLDTVEEGEE